MQKRKLLNFLVIFLIFIITPFASAYGFEYYSSPAYLLDNEWVLFIILFLMFFAMIYYTVNKSFKNNVISGVIALGLSLLISLAIAKKGLLVGYGYGLDSWVLLIAILIGFAFLIRFSSNSFGKIGAIAAVIVIWMIIKFVDPYNFLPETLLSNPEFMSFYETFLKSPLSLVIFGFLALVFGKTRSNEDPVQSFFRRLTGGH
jgi:hypothetical protein